MGLDDAATVGLRRRRRVGWLLVVAGLGLWLPLLIPIGRNLYLQTAGTRLQAVVSDQEGTERPLNWASMFRVHYSWHHRAYSPSTHADTQHGLLNDGDHVTVLIDPAHPERAMVDGQWFYDFSKTTQWVIVAELFVVVWVGLAMVIIGFVRLTRVRQLRRILVQAPWQRVTFRGTAPLRSGSPLHVEVEPDKWRAVWLRRNPRRLLHASELASFAGGAADGPFLELAQPSGSARAVIRAPGSSVLLSVVVAQRDAETRSRVETGSGVEEAVVDFVRPHLEWGDAITATLAQATQRQHWWGGGPTQGIVVTNRSVIIVDYSRCAVPPRGQPSTPSAVVATYGRQAVRVTRYKRPRRGQYGISPPVLVLMVNDQTLNFVVRWWKTNQPGAEAVVADLGGYEPRHWWNRIDRIPPAVTSDDDRMRHVAGE